MSDGHRSALAFHFQQVAQSQARKSELQSLYHHQLHGLVLNTRTHPVLLSLCFHVLMYLAVSEHGTTRLVSSQVTLPTLRSCVKLDRQPYERRLPLTWRQRRHQSVRTIGKLKFGRLFKNIRATNFQQVRRSFRQWAHIGAPSTLWTRSTEFFVRAFRVDSSGAAPVYVVIDKILDDTEETSRQLGLEASDRARELLLQCSSAGEAFFNFRPP